MFSDFQNIVSNSILMHQPPSLFSKILHAPLLRSTHVLFLLMTVSKIVLECVTIMHANASLCQNNLCSSKYRQNAPFTVLVFNIISVVQNRFKCRQNALFSVPVCKIFSAVPTRFQYRQIVPFTVLVFNIFSAVPNRLK